MKKHCKRFGNLYEINKIIPHKNKHCHILKKPINMEDKLVLWQGEKSGSQLVSTTNEGGIIHMHM